MIPPDEVRAAYHDFLRQEARGCNLPDDWSPLRHPSGEYMDCQYERNWPLYQSAYASGSAARRERDVGIVREHQGKCVNEEARRAFSAAIERIEKE